MTENIAILKAVERKGFADKEQGECPKFVVEWLPIDDQRFRR